LTFLVDAQLPPELARWILARGTRAIHVADVGLLKADDRTLWEFARQHEATIISKDEDFVDHWLMDENPVALIWVRKRNCSNRVLLAWFEPLWADVLARLEQGERLIELRE
jgi:predicted nuclease of predicted toxin-antitoxin system